MKRFFLLTVALLTVWAAAAQMRFVDATELNLIGKALPTPHPYHRIDTVAYKGFTKGENQQVRCSAGLALVFKTNSTRIDLEPQYTSFVYAGASTPRVASEGFDLYIRKDGEWLYAASRAPKKRGEAYTMISRMDSSEKECLLYLPNYSELTSLRVGVDEGATITPMENPFRHKIVIFGSSFTHGVSTSRAGMSYPMQIGPQHGPLLLQHRVQRQLQAATLFRRLPRRRKGRRRDGFRRLFESRREDDRRAADSLHRTHPREAAFDAADLRADDLPRERQFRPPFPQNRRGQARHGPVGRWPKP